MLATRLALRRGCRRHQHQPLQFLPAIVTDDERSVQQHERVWIASRSFSSGMDAFMEFEREMAIKRMQSQVRDGLER